MSLADALRCREQSWPRLVLCAHFRIDPRHIIVSHLTDGRAGQAQHAPKWMLQLRYLLKVQAVEQRVAESGFNSGQSARHVMTLALQRHDRLPTHHQLIELTERAMRSQLTSLQPSRSPKFTPQSLGACTTATRRGFIIPRTRRSATPPIKECMS